PSPKYTKIEITPEAYLALESETILQSKSLKRLASELILKGISKESLDFAQRALAVGGKNKFDEKMMAKVIKDIGDSSIKINEILLKTAQEKLQNEGYLGTILYVAQNTASMERDELHRILTICAYHKVPHSLAADILAKLNEIDSQSLAQGSSRKEEKLTRQTRPASGSLPTPH
ncbi:MAG: hypothetical protein LUQ22_06110, partial [Methanotrichaceae archaeon]|nr:hypothetical protein [Methanotrichaceae archaeon]